MSHGVTGGSCCREFGDDVKRIGRGNDTQWSVSKNGESLLADAVAVATQASLKLIDCRLQDSRPIVGADAAAHVLRGTERRHWIRRRYHRS